MKHIVVTGRNYQLSSAELESVFGSDSMLRLNKKTIQLRTDSVVDAQKLGSVIRVAEYVSEVAGSSLEILFEQIRTLLLRQSEQHEGKITLGVSLVADKSIDMNTVQRKLKQLKSEFKSSGRSLRIVPSREEMLNIATFRSNSLQRGDKKLEYLSIQTKEGWTIGRSTSAPDIDGFTARDRRKPFRDSRNGMLPPQLARTLVNIATQGQYDNQTVLDPFCGSGTLLLEARTLGINVVGSDINPDMTTGTQQNLQWQDVKLGPDPAYVVTQGDAQTQKWSDITGCATETYLGTPFTSRPKSSDVAKIINPIDTLHREFFANLAEQTNPGFRTAVAVPAWIVSDKQEPIRLQVIDSLGDLGYNHVEFTHRGDDSPLLYKREGQFVARDIIVVTRK